MALGNLLGCFSRKKTPANADHGRKQDHRSARPRGYSFQPRLEILEDRTLLSVSLTGVPSWREQGPGGIYFGKNVVNLPNQPSQAGKITAVAVHPTDPDRLFVATVNGGIWSTTNATSEMPDWTPLTDQLPSLSIGDIAFSPLDPNTLFAGTARFSSGGGQGGPLVGLYRTTDSGTTWTQLGQGTFGDQSIGKIVPTSLWNVGSGAPLATQVVLVLATNGIYRSTDGGASWGLGPVLPGPPSALAADPGDLNRFYAGIVGQGIYRSDDSGQTWNPVNNFISPTVVRNASTILLAVHNNAAQGTNTVWAALYDADPPAVYLSGDQGGFWAPMGRPAPIGGSGLVADPTDPSVVYIGGRTGGTLPNCIDSTARIFRGDGSQPQGSEWTPLVCDGANGTAPHPDSTELEFDPNGNLLNTNDGGIYRFYFNPPTNHPEWLNSWVSVNGSIRPTEVYSVAFDTVNNALFSGTQDNGSPEQNGSPDQPSPDNFAWSDQTGGDGGMVAVDNTSDPLHSIHYVSSQNLLGFRRQTWGSKDGIQNLLLGETPVKLIVSNGFSLPVLEPIPFETPYVLDMVAPRRMLLGVNSTLYESLDQGDNLRPLDSIGTIDPEGLYTPFAYGGMAGGVAYPGVIWAGGGGNLWLRTGGFGTALTQVTTYTQVGGAAVKRIVMDPDNWRTVYILDNNNKVWRGTNAGATRGDWTDLSDNLGQVSSAKTGARTTDLRTIELYDPTPGSQPGDGVLLVGGLGGVYRMLGPAGCGWTQYGRGLPNVLVTDLHAVRSGLGGRNNMLVAATFGRGVWTIPAGDVTVPGSLVIAADNNGFNDITLRRSAANPNFVEVVQNGRMEFADPLAVPWTALGSITISASFGNTNTTVNVESTFPCIPVTVSGAARVNVGRAGSVRDILGPLTIDNPPSRTALTIDNHLDRTAGLRPTLNSTSLTGLAPAVITWVANDLSSLRILGGDGGLAFTVANTPENNLGTFQTTLVTGTGSDTVSVHTTTGLLDVFGDGSDTVTLGGLGYARRIRRNVFVGGAGMLNVYDSLERSAQTPTLRTVGSTGFIDNLTRAEIQL